MTGHQGRCKTSAPGSRPMWRPLHGGDSVPSDSPPGRGAAGMSPGEDVEETGEQPRSPLLAVLSTSCSPPRGSRAPSPLGPGGKGQLDFQGQGGTLRSFGVRFYSPGVRRFHSSGRMSPFVSLDSDCDSRPCCHLPTATSAAVQLRLAKRWQKTKK